MAVGGFDLLDEHLQGAAFEAPIDLGGDGGLQGFDGLEALGLDVVRDAVGLLAGGESAGTGTIGGDVDLIEAKLSEEVVGVLELGRRSRRGSRR